jgi:FkbH-like protein
MLVCVSSTFTSEPIQGSLEFWLSELGYESNIKFAPFNQVFQSVLDPQSLFACNHEGVNVVLLRWQDLGRLVEVEENAGLLLQTLTTAKLPSPLIVASSHCSPAFLSAGAGPMVERLDRQLTDVADRIGSLHKITASELSELYPVEDYFSGISDELAHIPFTGLYFATLGTAVARKIDCLKRIPAKVIAVDLDNTLWGGIVGENGPDGVVIDGPRRELQRLLLDQRAQGRLLAIVSKNNENEVWETFRRPEMLLKPEHFTADRINWEPKSLNLIELSRELSLGLDTFIFVDDSAKEIAEVETNLPQVRTLLLPETSVKIPQVLRHFWPFDLAKVTKEDRLRSESYAQEKARQQAMEKAGGLEDFLANLRLEVTIEDLKPDMLGRVSQLTLRTNQFNTTTIRRSEAELQTLLSSDSMRCITVAAKDRFGDYGNVGAVIYSSQPAALIVDSFLLSCRALGRGVEHRVVGHLGAVAQQSNVAEIRFLFQATKRNLPASQFLESLPATREQADGIEVFRLSSSAALELVCEPVVDRSTVIQEEALAISSEAPKFNRYRSIASHLRTPREIARAVPAPASPGAEGKAQMRACSSKGEPHTEVEVRLAAIWASVLKLPRVSIYDDFFELGGDSFLGVDLLMRVIEEFGADHLTLSSVMKGPTVASFAKLVETKENHFNFLVPLRSTGSRPILFLIPGAGGNVLSLRLHATALPEDQPVWCLQAPGLDGGATVDNVSDMAALYVSAIRSLQSHGPYFLGGASYGGVIALEVAQRLIASDEKIGFLYMNDTYNLAFGRTLSWPVAVYYNVRFLLRRSARHLRQYTKVPLTEWQSHFKAGLLSLTKHIRGFATTVVSGAQNEAQPKAEGPRLAAGQEKTELLATLERVRDSTQAAVEAYVPSPFPGKITLFRATERMVEPYEDDFLGWGPIAQMGVECEVFESDHVNLAQHRDFAPTLTRLLRQAQEQCGFYEPEACTTLSELDRL